MMAELNLVSDLPLRNQLLNVVNPEINPTEVAITVAQIIESNVNGDQIRRELRRLASLVKDVDELRLVDTLKASGFTGEEKNIFEIDNSRIDIALETKRANPITLAMIVLGVAKHLDIECYGINFPHHFLANVNGKLVDPLQMEIVSSQEMIDWAKKNQFYHANMFRRASNTDIAVRMLNNASNSIDLSSDPVTALRLVDYKSALFPDSIETLAHRAEIWANIGEFGIARELIEGALKSVKDKRARRDLRQSLDHIPQIKETLN